MDITGTLAKLLATENLTVQHSNAARTASFNVQDRVLTLPVLAGASQEVMTMLAAHEVGHALQTPSDWTARVIDGTPFDFVNVIEDVRIEKFIQAKFPGLKRDFSRGYTELNDNDFFAIADQDVNKMSLIDRLNIHFKLGYRAVVEFAADEKQWVQAIDECDTFDKVCLVAKMLSDWLDQKAQDKEEDKNEEQQSDGAGQEDGESEEQSEEVVEDFGSKGSKGEDKEDEGEVSQENTVGDKDAGTPDEKVSQTQQSMTDAIKDLVKPTTDNRHNVAAQDGNLENITDISTIRESFRPYNQGGYNSVRENYNQFLLSVKKEVNHMVQRFEMKKSADAYARASINKTGVLNTSRLHQYKLTDDIFLRQTVTPDGKSHGMVMFVDWSGSMVNELVDTVKQLLVLVQFCRKVQVPFQVFAFTTPDGRLERHGHAVSLIGKVSNASVGLYEVLNSTAKKAILDQDMFNLFSQAYVLASGYATDAVISDMLNLGGTPLDNALTMVPAIVDRFRAATGAQKVSFVALTDGQSSPLSFYEKSSYSDEARMSYSYYDTTYVKYGNETFQVDTPYHIDDTCGIVSILKKVTTEVTFTNIFIGGKGACATHIHHCGGVFKGSVFTREGGYATTEVMGWDLVSALNSKSFNQAQEEIQVEGGAKKTQIKSALKKFLKASATSKTLLNQLVDQLA
ncbi:ribosome assembly protein [Synechococcus phage S-CREM2]|nr:ribosome assembly protein [Synechococcus phage S-CREM2]